MPNQNNLSLVSIIMPAYNAGKYIKESIVSVIEQTYNNWELIIVNDGSNDNTLEISEKFAMLDERIKVITQVNKRLAATRNTGIKNANGEWIAFLDSDDIWHAEKLKKQILLCKLNPEVDIIFSGGWIFNENDLTDLKSYPTVYGGFTPEQMYGKLYDNNFVPVLSVLVKADLIKKIRFSEEKMFYYGCEDWDCWLRAIKAGAKFYGIDEPLFYYRRHGNNMSNKGLEMHIAQSSCMLKNYIPEFDTGGMIKQKFKNMIDPLVSKLIVDNKTEDAILLLNGLAQLDTNAMYKLRMLLVKTLGKFSVYPVRLIAKLEHLKIA